MRFNSQTTIRELAEALAPLFERAEERGELTLGQDCLGAAIAIAVQHPESQTARDLLYWADGCTPDSAFEGARAETAEEWMAKEDMHLLDGDPSKN